MFIRGCTAAPLLLQSEPHRRLTKQKKECSSASSCSKCKPGFVVGEDGQCGWQDYSIWFGVLLFFFLIWRWVMMLGDLMRPLPLLCCPQCFGHGDVHESEPKTSYRRPMNSRR